MTALKKIFWTIFVSVFVVCEDVPDDLGNLSGHKKSKQKIAIYTMLFCFWILIILIAVYSYIYFSSRSTVFMVSGNVEKVTISPYSNQKNPEWVFTEAILHSDCGEDNVKVSGLLHTAPNTYVEFLRVQNNELNINLDNDESDSVGVFVTEANESIVLDDCASLRVLVKGNESYVFPIEGDIKLGGDIKESSSQVPILYSGKVTVVDKEILSGQFYSVGPFPLEMGDIFFVEDLQLKSSGFVQLDDEKGIKVIYSSKSKRGYIKKYKTEPFEIQNGFWTKIYNDPSLVILWFFGIAFYALSRSVIRISFNNLPNKNKTED